MKESVRKPKVIAKCLLVAALFLIFTNTLVFANEALIAENKQTELFTEFIERHNAEREAQSRASSLGESDMIGMFWSADTELGNFTIGFYGRESVGRFDHVVEELLAYTGIDRDRLDVIYFVFDEWTMDNFRTSRSEALTRETPLLERMTSWGESLSRGSLDYTPEDISAMFLTEYESQDSYPNLEQLDSAELRNMSIRVGAPISITWNGMTVFEGTAGHPRDFSGTGFFTSGHNHVWRGDTVHLGNSLFGGRGQAIGVVTNVRYAPSQGLDVVEVALSPGFRMGQVPDTGRAWGQLRSNPAPFDSLVRYLPPHTVFVSARVWGNHATIPGQGMIPTHNNMTILRQSSFGGDSGAAIVWFNGWGELAVGTLVGGGEIFTNGRWEPFTMASKSSSY